ncbi:hypothetical protein [Siphonobacter sp. SORGH_AS_0500]|uniref:hypothetical protein n=1 Tax=Siphonobacter sp. SORGH_AS_0500 TaxID=1864824 RepID=UPI0012FECC78|nr:hypothetical protein [Siphonobacter sp. SORGH_AS_0500]
MTSTPTPPLSLSNHWSFLRRLGIWFVAIYSVCYAMPLVAMLGLTPLVETVGNSVLRMKDVRQITNTGSGDTSFDYAYLVVLTTFALTLALVLAMILRNRFNYPLLYVLTQTFVRYYLAYFMLIYGFVKVFEAQFRYPDFYTLEQTYGDSSPMGIVWRLMGLSRPYSIFGGLGEVIGGLLLFFRRTKALGALVVIAVMTNVVMLNFSFDIPVKLFSSYLLLLAFFILAPDLSALYHFFILHKPSSLNRESVVLSKKWHRITHVVGKTLVIFFLLFVTINGHSWMRKPDHPLRGIYEVKSFVLGKDTLPPLTTDTVRWNKLLLENNFAEIRLMNRNSESFMLKIDEKEKTIALKSDRDSTSTHLFHYQLQKDSLSISGAWRGKDLKAGLKRKKISDYNLTGRGFHWINEYPYNR